MTRVEIKKKLRSVCIDLFNKSGVDPDLYEYIDYIDDLGMDSITFISLIVEIENQFQIQLPDDLLLMDNFRNMDLIIDHIKFVMEKSELGEVGIDSE